MKLAKLNHKPEIFYSIQGEGPSIGKPAIFIRLSMCNLHCIWCDTDYTWNWENTNFKHIKDVNPDYKKFKKEEWQVETNTEEIISEIDQYPCQRIIITGGEPLMQQKELAGLATTLANKGYCIEIETNGTLVPSHDLDFCIKQYNVSPKLANSNNAEKLRDKQLAMQFFTQSKKAAFKFVIEKPNDLNEVLELISKYQIASEKVYLMPQGTTGKELIDKQQWLVEQCKSHGFNYTDRLHILIYGDKKGV